LEITFSYIKNRIKEHSKQDLLNFSYLLLNKSKNNNLPIWSAFLLLKWTYLYASNLKKKELTKSRFSRLLRAVTGYNESHISKYIKNGEISKSLQILYSQQFYLQKSVNTTIFATQLKLYKTLFNKGNYNIEQSFFKKTGLSIFDFLFISQLVWLYINLDELSKGEIKFEGYFSKDFIDIAKNIVGINKIELYISLLTINLLKQDNRINDFNYSIRSFELQPFEITIFTMFPFYYHQKSINLIHHSVFNYMANYYIYDFLKSYDKSFTTEFGENRFEKYVELGVKKLDYEYKNEMELKKILPKKSNIVDFMIVEHSIFIECKAVELQSYPSINPTDDLIFSSLKKSILKAYYKQLLSVSNTLNPNTENWGIILTYKELYWSDFTELYELSKSKFNNPINNHLPPENVFIIDIYTWDKIVQIVSRKNINLIDILKKAKRNNSKFSTKKQLFDMHLDDYNLKNLNIEYLKDELKMLDLK